MPNLEKLPHSPVTGNSNVQVVSEFSAKDIIDLYRLQENVDVGQYFRNANTVYLMTCMDTSYRFFYPFEVVGDEDFYKRLQKAHEKRGLEYDQDRLDDHSIAFEQIETDDKVLEIGCNTGKFLKKIVGKTQNTLGLEFNSIAAERARHQGLDVIGESIEEHAVHSPEKYDVVCAFQVLEHVTNIKSFLTASIKALKPGGKLIFSVPNNEPYFQRFSKYEVLNLPPHHVGLWNLIAFEKLCTFYDVTLAESKLTSPSPLLTDAYLRAKLIAGVKSLPRRHNLVEMLKIGAVSPVAILRSSLDYFHDNPNHAFLSVVFRKNESV